MADHTFTIARLGNKSRLGRAYGEDEFEDVDKLLRAPAYDVVIVDQGQDASSLSLRALRALPFYSHSLIYLAEAGDAYETALSDGVAPVNTDEMLRDVQNWRSRQAQLGPLSPDWTLESSLLAWLWLRTGRKLAPVREATSAAIYRYPMLEVLHSSHDGDTTWSLEFALSEGWLHREPLLDRIRLCRQCSGGHLNYVDVCPECQALSIERQHSLHCFVCGHVGLQDTFTKDRGLFCPNCLTRLRHIGSDYDRPMENYGCRSCKAFFVDAAVQVHCLSCAEVQWPDELKVREISSYSLSEAGRLRCREGKLGGDIDIESRFKFRGVVSRTAFLNKLGWIMDIERRYKRMSFSLVGMRLSDLQATLNSLGEARGYALLDAVVARLTEIIRETDRCMRSAEDVIWLLLPETDAKGAQLLVKRLNVLMEEFRRANVEVVVKISHYTAPDDKRDGESAELLLQRLLGELFQ